jgi:serine/threonine kinase 16
MHTYRPQAKPAQGSGSAPPPTDGEILDHHGDSENDGASIPLVSKQHTEQGEAIFEGDDDEEEDDDDDDDDEAGIVPYAHRDLKPACVGFMLDVWTMANTFHSNVMLADDGSTPILMDFGSTIKARITIENSSQAMHQQVRLTPVSVPCALTPRPQDVAAEKSTMAYRAPELFAVQNGMTLDEKVDVWSLGCVLFALAYLHSPFETAQTTEHGGSIAMAVQSGRYKHPPGAPYSEGVRRLIDGMLKVDPRERPDIHQVLAATDRALESA